MQAPSDGLLGPLISVVLLLFIVKAEQCFCIVILLKVTAHISLFFDTRSNVILYLVRNA